MDKRTTNKLERELAEAMAEVVIVRNKKWKYPLMPSQRTLQSMAKAAAAVYEAAVEKAEPDESEHGPITE
ncbi:MAG: hypothetical protein WD049_09150 [Candidatus Paceibacterota bacterium]